jgi:ribosome biogenesis GTPase A
VLDSPGILPPSLPDQQAASLLAICDDIGAAAYDPEQVAAYFVDQLLQVQPQAQALLQQRYGWPDPIPPGSVAVQDLAERRYRGDAERAARQILNDYRKGWLGPLALQLPLAASPPARG